MWTFASRQNPRRRGISDLVVFADEDGGAEDGGPQAPLVADGGLRDVHGADDLVGDAVDLFFFVPGKIRIKFHVQGGREHFGGELFSVFAGDFFGFAEGLLRGEMAVNGFVRRKGQADAGGDQTVRLFGGILADDGESDLAGADVLQALAARNQFAIGRKDGGDADDVAGGNSRVAESELKTRKSFAMLTNALGEEDFLSDERHGAGLRRLRE